MMPLILSLLAHALHDDVQAPLDRLWSGLDERLGQQPDQGDLESGTAPQRRSFTALTTRAA